MVLICDYEILINAKSLVLWQMGGFRFPIEVTWEFLYCFLGSFHPVITDSFYVFVGSFWNSLNKRRVFGFKGQVHFYKNKHIHTCCVCICCIRGLMYMQTLPAKYWYTVLAKKW